MAGSTAKSKKKEIESSKYQVVFEVDTTECPFREFKDNELSSDFWGLGPAALRATIVHGKAVKPPLDYVWVDDQTQPLPRSVRYYLHGWVRAEKLASVRWGAEVVVFEESNEGGKMSVMDTQRSHAQVLMRSSFCRRVLSACFMLERAEGLTVEHQWENFVSSLAEGWRAKYHIYSPGMKPGGGAQHRPVISKNGCYLVRVYYLGTWRCVWVNDQIPVDATDAPLLPFSPLLETQPTKPGGKSAPAMVYSNVVVLWPMLICKQYHIMPLLSSIEQALLKLAAPDMNSDEETDNVEDELVPEFDIMHALTGCMDLTYCHFDEESLWQLLIQEIQVFSWEDDDETLASTIKSKAKKPSTKENREVRTRNTLATIVIRDTKDAPPYTLPGITPAHEMVLLVNMARDLPLKKPLPEPEVAMWKHYRWIEWARRHGLYGAYDCPQTRFLKVNGLMKLSYAPHLLEVLSTESTKKGKELNRSQIIAKQMSVNQMLYMKEELREWIQYQSLFGLTKKLNIIYFPSMFVYTSASSLPLVRITKSSPNRALDIAAPKCSPLYLQIDGPEEITLRLALATLHPRILMNSGIPIAEYMEPAYLILEKFEWFVDCDLPMVKAFVQTSGYDAVEVKFRPGRHCCRLWVHSRLNWHVMLLSESTLLLGPRDVIQGAAVRECPWAAKFLNNLSHAFLQWIKNNRSNICLTTTDRDFYKSYQPDLTWDPEEIGYKKKNIHWMFRQALQSLLKKRLPSYDYHSVCKILRHYFSDPDFGFPPKPLPPKSLRYIVAVDPCDCLMPDVEEMEVSEEYIEEELETEEKPVVDAVLMSKLLTAPMAPNISQVCEFSNAEHPCGILKEEREKVVRKHEAAILLQAHWRGTWARKCLNVKVMFTPDILKLVMDHAFGNLEALSALMNEFFGIFSKAKSAYSVASALSGVYGLIQHQGTSTVSGKCKWIPYFQGVFFCHAPVKVHFTVQSTLQYSTVMIYNNDTKQQLPQAYNAHIAFDILPNVHGYTVMGHGTLDKPKGHHFEVHWQLTILSSQNGAFHVCDNDVDGCKERSIPWSNKLHIDEVFIPNRRNILGGLLITVTKEEAISFRAAASSPELEMMATLRVISPEGDIEELATCHGIGEVFWPYLIVQPYHPDLSTTNAKKKSTLHFNDQVTTPGVSGRSMPKASVATPRKIVIGSKNKSMTKIKTMSVEPRQYSIQVTAPAGWPLTMAQWKRVDEVRNAETVKRPENRDLPMKSVKGKGGKEQLTARSLLSHGGFNAPQLEDAYVELECALPVGGGVLGKRDDLRDMDFIATRKMWEAKEPGRNSRGAQLRNEFRTDFLATLPSTLTDTLNIEEENYEEMQGEEENRVPSIVQQGPTPATESGMLETSMEMEEEAKYPLMPEQLRDKFVSLHFLPFCMKEKNEDETVLLTNDMAEAAKKDRHARIEAAEERMRELQAFNRDHVLMRQERRCRLLEQLCVDGSWCQDLIDVLEQRDECIAQEQLARNVSATKKKQEQKDQKKK